MKISWAQGPEARNHRTSGGYRRIIPLLYYSQKIIIKVIQSTFQVLYDIECITTRSIFHITSMFPHNELITLQFNCRSLTSSSHLQWFVFSPEPSPLVFREKSQRKPKACRYEDSYFV